MEDKAVFDIPAAAPPPQQQAARAVRVVLGRLAEQKDLLLLDQVTIDALAVDVSREVHNPTASAP